MIGVEVAWGALEEAESTWEPLSRVFHDTPAVLRKVLKALRFDGGAAAGARTAVWDVCVITEIYG